MNPFRLIICFIKVSFQEETAYRSNFLINFLYSILNLATGILGIVILFGQIQNIQGWTLPDTLALLGVYLTISAMRALFIGPGLESLAGMDGEIWSGAFDFTLLRPVNTQFLVSVRKWKLFALFDLALGIGVLAAAVSMLQVNIGVLQILAFLATLATGFLILYAILLIFAAFVFWSPGVLFTWVFEGFFQMARYPVGMYPGWLRFMLTWIIPVGVITTIPVEALTGSLSISRLFLSSGLALLLIMAATFLFRKGVRRYSSASS
jgi:ABC-2 type transport system permease protein